MMLSTGVVPATPTLTPRMTQRELPWTEPRKERGLKIEHGDNCLFRVSASLVMTHNGVREWVDDKDADRISISLFPVSQHQPGPGRCKRRLTIPHLLGCLIPDHPSFGSIQLQNGCKTVLKKYFFGFLTLYQPLVFLTKP